MERHHFPWDTGEEDSVCSFTYIRLDLGQVAQEVLPWLCVMRSWDYCLVENTEEIGI